MPRYVIPSAERRVGEQPLPGAQQISGPGPAGFGAQEAGVIGRAGQQVGQLGEVITKVEEREQLVATKVKEAELKRQAEYKERRDKLLAGTAIVEFKDNLRNQKQVYFNRRGVDAFGITDEANKYIADLKKTMRKDLNPEAAVFFDAATGVPREMLLNQTLSREASEFNRAEDANTDAKISLALNEASDAVGTNGEPLAIESARESMNTAMEQKINKAGMTGATAKNFKDEHISAFHEGVLNRMVVDDAERAKKYFTKHEKEIVPENREGIEKVLKVEDTLQFAQQRADEIFIIEDDPAKRLKLAREEPDPEKRKELESQVKVRNKELEQLAVESQQEAYLDTLDKIFDAQNLEEGLGFAKRIENPEDRIKAEKVANARFERKKRDVVTDIDIQADMYEQIDSGEIKTVRELKGFYPDLSNADYDKAIAAVRNKKNPNAKVPSMSYATAKNALSAVIGKQYDVELHSNMFMYVLDKLDTEAQILGRSLSLDEAIKATSNYMVKGESIGEGFWGIGGYDPDTTLLEAVQNDTLETWLPDVNDEDEDGGKEKRDIIAAFNKSLGFTINNEVLFRLYKKEEILKEELSPQQNKLYDQELEREKKKGNR